MAVSMIDKDSRETCDRCFKRVKALVVSNFNEDKICHECLKTEEKFTAKR